MRRHLFWMLPTAAGALLVGLWYGVVRFFHLEAYVLPTPDEILQAPPGANGRTLLASALITGQGAFLGFLAAVGGGSLLSANGRGILDPAETVRSIPHILVLQMTPVIILAPIFVLWFGQGLPSIVAITFMICFFPVVANTTMGLISG